MERLVTDGYVKMLAINVGDIESSLIDERNTNYLCDIEYFQEKYNKQRNVKCVYIHMDNNYDINFVDYQKIHKHIHPFDYMRNVVKEHGGKLIEGSNYLHISSRDEYVELKELDLKEDE